MTESAANAIQRVHYTHDAMIDLIIAKPMISQGDIARHFGYTEGWVSRVINSDAFEARLAARKQDLVDPVLLQSIEEGLRGMAHRSISIVMAKLDAAPTPDFAIKALELSAKALGFGARPQNIAQVNNFVVALPAMAKSSEEWAATATASRQGLQMDRPREEVHPSYVVEDATPKVSV